MPTFELTYSSGRTSARREPIHPFAAAVALLARWIERSRQRDALASLEAHMLRDIGITRAEAARECRKPFWR